MDKNFPFAGPLKSNASGWHSARNSFNSPVIHEYTDTFSRLLREFRCAAEPSRVNSSLLESKNERN
jgi:hypothetical protein